MAIDEVRLMLGDASTNYSNAQIELALRAAQAEVADYTARATSEFDDSLNLIVDRIAVIKLQRIGTEALESMGMGGVSESYINDYPKDIMRVLNRRRKLKVM